MDKYDREENLMSNYQKLADCLEVNVEYLEEMDPEIHENTGSSGEMVYDYYFYIPEGTHADILDGTGWTEGELINGIPLSVFQDEEIDEYEHWISQFTKAFEVFHRSLTDIENLLLVQVENEVEKKYLWLLYANLITTLEAYLNDVFAHRAMGCEKYIRNMFERTGVFAHDKMKVRDLYKRYEEKEGIVLKYLQGISWHDIVKVEKLFKGVLGIKLTGDLVFVKEAVIKRHDIVHRNGFTKQGKEVEIKKNDITKLKDKIVLLVEEVEENLKIEDQK